MISGAAQWNYVFAAYGITAVIVIGLITWVVQQARRQARILAALEMRGVRRRSDHTAT